ncbi:HlyC/CorC family transporter [Flavobacterium sp. MAH-1]|uniref:HlyC/CorC family transporter n=1 Tax=Flavobacterium agri TaxID=2743471 RepID=A0A7Y8Y5Y4_9FLAO|nr:hemolysin family protein [Flavobacterium agri]NUY82514.1 HlyC/CorC family transporter [Flavobacterium agri]NYA72538.1 HlyC/CorC family transporter [Flavobacterium agri]
MQVSIIIASLILAAFFSGMEIAFLSANKIYLEIEKKQDSFLSQILKKLTEKPSKFIAAMLVGSNLALVVYGFFASRLILDLVLPYHLTVVSNLLLQTTIATLVIVFTSEFLPKVFFHIYANSLIRFFAFPAYVFYKIFYYISSLILWFSDMVLKKFFGTGSDPVQVFFSKVELGNFITEQMSSVDENEEVDSEIQIFQNALDFSGVKARDIMTPRMEISAIDIYAPVSELRELFIETGYSKILVYQESLDDIVGYVHSFDLFRKPRTIKSVLIPVEFVPQTIFIKDAMDQLTKKRKSVAVVLDEYGGTAGIVTMEDIVEELFGEIEDEHDEVETLTEQKIDDATWLFSTRHDVEYLNEKYDLDIPEGDSYSTLGGFIVDSLNEIPQKGAQFSIGKFRFSIEEATAKKIELVRMTVSD